VGFLQNKFKDLKDTLKREGHKDKMGWKSALQGVKLLPIELGYRAKSLIELLLEGNMSAILEILRPQNYTLLRIQEEIRSSCLYYVAKDHFSLEYAVFLMEQAGLDVEQVLGEYYCHSLRKDIRKKIARYFKEKGVVDSLISPFIAFQEIFAPVDSITIAMRRKYASKVLLGATRKAKNLQNLWREGGELEEPKDSPVNLIGMIEKAESFGEFMFELDDLEYDEPGAAYLRREYERTRYYKDAERGGSLVKEKGPFSIEEFRGNDRKMHEVNMRLSSKGKDKFKPKEMKKRSKEKLKKYCQEILKGFFGREVRIPESFMSRVDLDRQESGYFQYKVIDTEDIEAKVMLAVVIERLKLGICELIELFAELEEKEKEKYLEFLVEFLVERKDFGSLEEILAWAMATEFELFKNFFEIGEDNIVRNVPPALSKGEDMRRFVEFMLKKHFSVGEEVIGMKELVGLLAKKSNHSKLDNGTGTWLSNSSESGLGIFGEEWIEIFCCELI